jgi:hypothetical protein
MNIYRQNFVKTVFGYFEVKAENAKEATAKFQNGEGNETENISDYEVNQVYLEKENG